MYDKKFAKYYDRIYAKKDYHGEVDRILELVKMYSKNSKINTILDVGCGTGEHALELARRGYDVVGVDISPYMIDVAKAKKTTRSERRLDFYCCNVEELNEQDFDLAISMFNVINHIDNIAELLNFLRAINERLRIGGLYFFDCWNGVAALRDPPKDCKSETRCSDCSIMTKTIKAKTDLFKSTAIINGSMKFSNPESEEIVDTLNINYKHILWTPKTISDLLKLSNFEVLAISRLDDFYSPATYKDWKITFLSEKV